MKDNRPRAGQFAPLALLAVVVASITLCGDAALVGRDGVSGDSRGDSSQGARLGARKKSALAASLRAKKRLGARRTGKKKKDDGVVSPDGGDGGGGGSACMQAAYDLVGKNEEQLKKIWGMTSDSNEVHEDYTQSSQNCVNNTDFWQVRVFGNSEKPMSKSDTWFKETQNCVPFQKNKEGKANDHLVLDRNPAKHWEHAVGKLAGDTLVRVSLINQHERDKNKAVNEKRHCKGAHATSFYYKKSQDRMYQLPAAWVNMYTVKQWVDANGGKPWSMPAKSFFSTLAQLFESGVKCEDKWTAFKTIFMPPKGHLKPKDFSSWAIPPIFAKLEGHAQITEQTNCANPDDEWYTEPNKAFKSPYVILAGCNV